MNSWRRADTDRIALLVLAACAVLAVVEILHFARGQTFFYDEWEYVIKRAGHDPGVFLRPHNEHASLVPILIYKILFETVGLSHYVVYQFVHVVLMQVLAGLVYLYCRPRLGRWWGLFPAVALTLVGSAPGYVLQTFELSFTLSLIGIVGALLAFQARRDAIAVVLLLLSLFSSGVGLTVFPAFVLLVLFGADRRERMWVVLIPALVYLIWWVPYHQGSYPLHVLSHTPPFVEGEYTAGVAALTSLSALANPLALVLAVAALVGACRSPGRRPAYRFALLAPLGFWFATAIARYGQEEPSTDRYLIPSVTLLALVIAELGAGRTAALKANGRMVIVGAALLGLLVLSNAGRLTATHNAVLPAAPLLKPMLGALELARATAPADLQPSPDLAPDITAKGYFAALDRYKGSPAASPAEIASAAPDARARADGVLVAALGLAPAGLPRPPRGCAPAGADVALSGGALVVDNRKGKAPATVSVRRFADAPGQGLPGVAAGAVAQFAVPQAARGAYPLQFTVGGTGFATCTTA